MDEHGPVFVIVRNRRAAGEIKKKLPKGSRVVVDPCALDHYMDLVELDKMNKVAKAKDQMGVS